MTHRLAILFLLVGACGPKSLGRDDRGPAPVAPAPDGAPPHSPSPDATPPTGTAPQPTMPAPDAAPGVPDSAPASAACPPGSPTPQETAATPRADLAIEQLAIVVSKGKIVADQAIYDRLARDIPALKSKNPTLAKYSYEAPYGGKSLIMTVTTPTLQKMRNGTYEPWVCPNRLYGALEDKFDLSASIASLIVLYFKGIYNEDLLAAQYAQLPGVTMASPNYVSSINGPGPTICATPAGETWHYVFVGDVYTHFTVAADGTQSAPVTFNPRAAGNPNPPPWVAQYTGRDSCYLPGR
jgi:hypothetical protein